MQLCEGSRAKVFLLAKPENQRMLHEHVFLSFFNPTRTIASERRLLRRDKEARPIHRREIFQENSPFILNWP